MGRKRRSIHSPKFAKRIKYAALKKSKNSDLEESEIELRHEPKIEQQPVLEPESAPEILIFNPPVHPEPEPEPVKVEAREEPKRKPRKPTTRKRTTRKKTVRKEG